MDRIETPHILDPERIVKRGRNDFFPSHEARADALAEALEVTCAYAQRLWRELDAVRAYLLDTAPEIPTATNGPVRRCASPTGPDDEQGWGRWTEAYASVTTLLEGERGDSGYGEQEARREARDRRQTGTATRGSSE